MALSGSFLIATNIALTIAFSGFEDLIHKTDESDNPQDLDVLYIGSLDATKQLQAASNPGVSNLTLTPTDILPIFQISHAYTLGQCIQATTTVGVPGKRFQCTTAGTSAGSEPTWATTIGSTTNTGSAVFICISDKHNIDEITLALTSMALGSNTPGDALSLGNTILGGTSNKVALYIRVNNNVDVVSNNTNYPEIGLILNSVLESTI